MKRSIYFFMGNVNNDICIGSIIAIRYICRVNLKKEEQELNTQELLKKLLEREKAETP